MEPDCPYETSVRVYENMQHSVKDDKDVTVQEYLQCQQQHTDGSES